jgi:hypothetical protein
MQCIRETIDDCRTLNLRGTSRNLYMLKELTSSGIDILSEYSTIIFAGLVMMLFD